MLFSKPPIEAKPWTDVKQTIKEGSMCIQFVKRVDKVYGSEDCLFLNVFTPTVKNLPTNLFILSLIQNSLNENIFIPLD